MHKCKRVFLTRLCCKKDKEVKMPPIDHIKKVLPKEQFESVELENFQMVETASKIFFWLLHLRQLWAAPGTIKGKNYLTFAVQWLIHGLLAWLFTKEFKLERRRYLLLLVQEIIFYRNIYTCFVPGTME